MIRDLTIATAIGIAFGLAAFGVIAFADHLRLLGTICIKTGTGYC